MKFLFLQYPIKIRKHTIYILVLSMMIALSIVLSYISIPIPSVGIKISFTWLPTIITGWFFGPVIGFITGFIIDTIGFLLHGGIWFWLYSIQEPILGFIVGIVSFLNYLITSSKKSLKTSFIVSEFIINIFVLVVFLILLVLFFDKYDLLNKRQGTNLTTQSLIITIFILLFCFYFIVQFIIIYKYKKKANSSFYFIVSLCCLITLIFSFIIGPIAAVEYLIYLNKKPPNTFIKYGYLAYLIPRVIKEMFKTPVYIFLLWGLVFSLNGVINRFRNQVINTWKV